jgi:YegS/Rv2252/BmrU family lipid kinase
MAMPRTLLVVNPQSQNGSLGRRWPELSKIVRREIGSFEEAFTKGPKDATDIARKALRDGVELVVAIGGDGTINEVANGFFDDGEPVAPEAAMGLLPFGTGGDFRKSLLIPKDMAKSAAILARGKVASIDLGNLQFTERNGEQGQRIFVNITSFGMSGEIDEKVNNASKRLGGRATFMIATLRVSMDFKAKRVRLTFDDQDDKAVESTISTVAVANGRYFGGGMKVAPEAELADGKFDVVALAEMGLRKSLLFSRHIYKGSHLGLDSVSSRRANKVHAESLDGQEVLLDMDGEVPGALPATFTILPEALRFIVP